MTSLQVKSWSCCLYSLNKHRDFCLGWRCDRFVLELFWWFDWVFSQSQWVLIIWHRRNDGDVIDLFGKGVFSDER